MSDPTGVAADQLKSFVERISNLEDQKQEFVDDIRDVYAEAKGGGFEPKILRTVVKLYREDKSSREEREALLDLYCSAIGL